MLARTMGEELGLPFGLLLVEKHYQVRGRSLWGRCAYLFILLLVVSLVWWLTWCFVTRTRAPSRI